MSGYVMCVLLLLCACADVHATWGGTYVASCSLCGAHAACWSVPGCFMCTCLWPSYHGDGVRCHRPTQNHDNPQYPHTQQSQPYFQYPQSQQYHFKMTTTYRTPRMPTPTPYYPTPEQPSPPHTAGGNYGAPSTSSTIYKMLFSIRSPTKPSRYGQPPHVLRQPPYNPATPLASRPYPQHPPPESLHRPSSGTYILGNVPPPPVAKTLLPPAHHTNYSSSVQSFHMLSATKRPSQTYPQYTPGVNINPYGFPNYMPAYPYPVTEDPTGYITPENKPVDDSPTGRTHTPFGIPNIHFPSDQPSPPSSTTTFDSSAPFTSSPRSKSRLQTPYTTNPNTPPTQAPYPYPYPKANEFPPPYTPVPNTNYNTSSTASNIDTSPIPTPYPYYNTYGVSTRSPLDSADISEIQYPYPPYPYPNTFDQSTPIPPNPFGFPTPYPINQESFEPSTPYTADPNISELPNPYPLNPISYDLPTPYPQNPIPSEQPSPFPILYDLPTPYPTPLNTSESLTQIPPDPYSLTTRTPYLPNYETSKLPPNANSFDLPTPYPPSPHSTTAGFNDEETTLTDVVTFSTNAETTGQDDSTTDPLSTQEVSLQDMLVSTDAVPATDSTTNQDDLRTNGVSSYEVSSVVTLTRKDVATTQSATNPTTEQPMTTQDKSTNGEMTSQDVSTTNPSSSQVVSSTDGMTSRVMVSSESTTSQDYSTESTESATTQVISSTKSMTNEEYSPTESMTSQNILTTESMTLQEYSTTESMTNQEYSTTESMTSQEYSTTESMTSQEYSTTTDSMTTQEYSTLPSQESSTTESITQKYSTTESITTQEYSTSSSQEYSTSESVTTQKYSTTESMTSQVISSIDPMTSLEYVSPTTEAITSNNPSEPDSTTPAMTSPASSNANCSSATNESHCDDDQFCPGELGSEVMPDAELGRYKWHDSRKWGGVIDLRFPVPCNGNITGVSFQARGSDNDLTWDNERPLWFFVARGQSPDDQCAFDEVVAVTTIKNNEGGRIRQVAFSTPMEVQEGDRWGFFWKWGVVAFDWNPMTGDGTDRTFIEDDKNYCGVVGKAKYKPVVGEPAEGYFTQDQSNKDSVSHRNYAFWVKYSCPCPEETTAQPPVPTTEEECVDGETKITKGPDVQPGVGKYLKHDTYFKKALISLRYPMPCNGVITRVKYQARGSSNDRSWNDDRKFSLTIFRGQDPNNPCTFSNFVGMRLLTNNVAGIVEQDLEMQNKTIRVEKDDHWGLYWADRKQGGGVVAFDWAESVGDKPNRVFLEENQNYCAHSMRQRVKIKDEPAVFELAPHTDKDSPTYRNYAFWYTVACDCEEEDNP